jgi:hypothetical protein
LKSILEKQLTSGKTKESISKKFISLRNSYMRERKREVGSKTTGTGSDEVYESKWKYYQEMDFLKEEVEGDESTDNLELNLEESKVKRMKRKSKDEEDEIKVKIWNSALVVLQSPDPVNFHVEPVISDPDEQWLLSLAPQLKSLNAHTRSLAKLRIQMILHELYFSGNQDALLRYNYTSMFLFSYFLIHVIITH